MTYEAQGISVRIGGSTLLDAVSLTLAPGEIVAVAGPNGAGKSTLLATLAGDLRPASGTVMLDGRALSDRHREDLATRRAVMSVEAGVAFSFTVREVVQLGRLPLHGGTPRQADREVVETLLESVDCAHLADRIFATLSTGERQRVQLARAVAQITEVTRDRTATGRFLLLDEPTSSLDPAHQHTAMRLLRRKADEGTGVLAVLHDLNLAAAYADRIILMHRMRIVAQGPPVDILRASVLESVFDIGMLEVAHPDVAYPLVVSQPDPVTGDRR